MCRAQLTTNRDLTNVRLTGGEGGIHSPPAASRAQMRLRRCLSRTGFEVLDPLGEKSKKGPDGAPFSFLAERVSAERNSDMFL